MTGGLILPTSAGSPISQWVVTDWTTPVLVTAPAENGQATIEGPQLEYDVQWLIDRAVASCTSETSTTLRLYDSGVSDANLLSGTRVGNFDEAEYTAGLLVRAQSSLVAQWVGCSAGAVGTLRLQARIMRRAS